MEQILHIFRKDARHLWPQALVVFMLTLAHAVFEVRRMPVEVPETIRVNAISNTLSILLPLGIWFLIASLIFQEVLPGDRQFWLTRPYRWPKLLASKVLFIAVFINVPLFLSDCYILGAQGFPVVSVLFDLLLRQLFLTALFVLPSFAIATVTSGVAQFVLAWFVLLLALLFEFMLASSLLQTKSFFVIGGGTAFIAALAITTSSIVIWQYARRGTTAARLLLLTVTCAFLPLNWGFSFVARFNPVESKRPPRPDQSSVRIGYDLARGLPSQTRQPNPVPGLVLARIPLTLVDLPPKTLLRGGGDTAIDVGGTAWPQAGSLMRSSVEGIGNEYWQIMYLEASKLAILKQHPVNLHTSFDLEIVTDNVATTVPLTRRSFFLSGVGLCRTFPGALQTQFACRAGLSPSVETTVRLDSPERVEQVIASFPPPSIPSGLSPTTDLGASSFSNVQSGAELAFIPRRKLAELQRTLDAHNVDLTKYVLPQ